MTVRRKKLSGLATAVDFLRRLTPAGVNGTVVSIDPETREIVGRGYVGGQSMDRVQEFIDKHSECNLYWTPNEPAQPLNKKAKKETIKSVRWVHLDLDDPSDGVLDRIRAYRLPPTLIVFSGGGYNVYWSLAKPVRANGNIEELESANKRVILDLGADIGTQNLDRILRLPFTTNWPTKTKLKRGRVPVPATLVEYYPERQYTLDQFPPLSAEEKRNWSKDEKTKKEDRSRDLLRKVAADMRAGISHEAIIANYSATDPHALDQSDPVRAVQRCIDECLRSDEIVHEINDKHALVWTGGELRVMWHEAFEGGMPRLSKVADLKLDWKPRQVGNINPIDLWIQSPLRLQYDSLVYRPGLTDTGNDFNLFRGWGLEPKPDADCSLFIAHLQDVICAGDDDLYDYLIQWLANSVQTPEDKPGTALTMQSDQGAGKGMVGEYIRPIYGANFCQLSSSEMLFGRFNDWLAGKIIVFGDEATWPGDRRGVDKLKALITERRIMIERKFVPAINIDNFARFIFTTNHDHAAPAEISDRRFVVLKPSAGHIGDAKYWEALVAERQHGGPAALLDHLLKVKVTRNLRITPKTEALGEQKLLSLDDVGRFWRDMLMDKWHVLLSGPALRFDSVVEPKTLHDFYLDFAKKNQIRFPRSIDSLAISLRQYMNFTRRKLRTGESVGVTGRPWVYELPPLSEARLNFEKRIGHPIQWPDVIDERRGIK